MNIIIMAGGPVDSHRPGTNRFLEVKNNKIVIDQVLSACTGHIDVSVHVVVDKQNIALSYHVCRKWNGVGILIPRGQEMIDSFVSAFSVPGDCIIVSGDLTHITYDCIHEMVMTDYKDAVYLLNNRWHPTDLKSPCGGYLRRSDICDAVFRLGQSSKRQYLNQNSLNKASEYFNLFYPGKQLRSHMANDTWTWLTYTYFNRISSNPGVNSFNKQGTVLTDIELWKDND